MVKKLDKKYKKYKAIDLGLPSGTKLANCNIGAEKPSDIGLYFQWGDSHGYADNEVGTSDGKKSI